jgi:hypothetical protein
VTATPAARTVRELRGWLRQRARQRAPRRFVRRLLDIYDTLFGLAMIGGLLAETVVHTASSHRGTAAGGSGPVTEWTVIVVAALVIVVSLTGLRAIGPIMVGRAAYTWIVSTPVDRGGVLVRRLLGLVAIMAGGGAVIGAVLTLTRSPGLPGPAWIVTTGLLAGVIVTTVAVVLQSGRASGDPVRQAGNYVIMALVAVAAVGTAAARLGWTPPAPVIAPLALIVPAGVLAVLLAAVAWIRLSRLDRHALTSGNDLATAAVVAGAWLDPSLLAAAMETRRSRRMGRVRSRRITGGWVTALLRAELARVRRRPSAVLVWSGLLLVPYLAGLIFSGLVAAPVHLLGTFLAADRFAGGLRTVCRSSALRFALGGSDQDLRLVHLLLPAGAAVAWGALAAPALPAHVLLTAAISAVGAVVVIYRMATRPPMDYASPMLATPFGVVPVNLLRQVARGPALLIVLGAAQIFIAGS